ncbi:MAG TPA: hypothetical protein VKP10_05985 [Gemmatimonadales bacterium]|nr:hypothetical protein [Gemmatimonadales bacterium]
MHSRSVGLLLGALALGAGACRGREPDTRRQGGSASPPESAAPAPTPPQPPPPSSPSPFPADKDTARLHARLAGPAAGIPSCGGGVPRITADSIGPFRPGTTVSELARRCRGLLYGWVMISDGYAVPTVAARVGGATVTGFASDSSPDAIVNRVELTGPGPRTAEGLGVGSTLGQLQSAYGVPQASESDCVLMVWFDTRPGLNFHLEYPPRERRDCGALSEPPLPATLRVASVVLVQR